MRAARIDRSMIRLELISLLSIGLLPLCAINLTACSKQGTSATLATPVPAQTADAPTSNAGNGLTQSDDPQLVPLSDADIQVYLTVMRAAAERVRHPSAQDIADLRQAAAIQARATQQAQINSPAIDTYVAAAKQAQAEANKGNGVAFNAASATAQTAMAGIDTHAAYDPEAAQRVLMLNTGQTDQVIVAERHIDADRYGRISDAIEEIVVPPQLNAHASCGGDCDNDAPPLSTAQVRHAMLHNAALARNSKRLQPYRKEIHLLQSVVRNPRLVQAAASP